MLLLVEVFGDSFSQRLHIFLLPEFLNVLCREDELLEVLPTITNPKYLIDAFAEKSAQLQSSPLAIGMGGSPAQVHRDQR